MTSLERYDLPVSAIPKRWYNVLPDLPRGLDDYLHPVTREPVDQEFMERLLPKALVAQETSTDRWITIPEEVRAAYRLWRPTPLFRATALERHLDTPAEIYFKYEGSSPSGSHKLNSALAQAYYARLEGVDRLVTDTGAGQWGSALSLACSLFGIKALVYMVRASFQGKPYRRHLMETFGQQVLPSPGPHTDFGSALLAAAPDHPGSEATAVSEALETVRRNPGDRFSMGAFANHVLLHQTVIGLETREQLEEIGKQPDFLVASVGCGSNLGGFAFPFVGDKLAGAQIGILAAEPAACPTLTAGEYRYDFADASGLGPLTRTYTLGHEFVPPPIHAGGLRYHGAAPLVGLARHEDLLDARAYTQKEVFEAGTLFARLHGLLPAPETAHAVRATIELAEDCRRQRRRAVIVFCYSGHGLLDLGAYGSYNAGEMAEPEPYECTLAAGDPALAHLAGR
ncbi:tryptophan synthase beta chain [Streptomyces cellostaticus]|uniref:tryptophan synthase n=1 Tax=Streptomyces cellostaticus TaxID=67285 RepID=A0A117PWG0_9ACTN|nr:TrpB-like pyridoxal phosphate-dependent enzyme [Streptomyces cellostaticus]KUM95631.1 tryptophan synthase beta chain [Streptomyces cellostaticus]GHI09779.1 TrpB-like pyridoxal-phosphate dependent enzyme [Streptomyces cellostaticus]